MFIGREAERNPRLALYSLAEIVGGAGTKAG